MEISTLQVILRHLEAKTPVVLVYPLRREGSVPTPAQACLVVHPEGRWGTVGGGLLEAEALALAEEVLQSGQDAVLERTLSGSLVGEEPVCGGSVTLALEYVGPEALPLWEQALSLACGGRAVGWRVGVDTRGGVRIRRQVACSDESSSQVAGPGMVLWDPIQAMETLLVFGAGHIAQALVPMASALGWGCVVVDDRPQFASRERFPQARELVVGDPPSCVAALPQGPHTWVAIMTRGHQHDAAVLAEVMRRRYRYVGMVGSRKKRDEVFQALMAQGIPASALAQVFCPIGLPLGGSSPPEIALSIAAQMVAVKYGRILEPIATPGGSAPWQPPASP